MFNFDSDDENLKVTPTTAESATEDRRAEIRVCSNSALAAMCVLLTLLAFGSGCGPAAKPWEKVYPASGKVNFQGQPLGGAELVLFPKDKTVPSSVRPTARTEADGTFQLGTKSSDDGAPAGEYDVVVTWRPLIRNGDAALPGPNQLPVRYSAPESSQLVVKIDGKAGEEINIPTLELTP